VFSSTGYVAAISAFTRATVPLLSLTALATLLKLLDMATEIRAFIAANEAKLKTKE
jgi:hypothetical protein